MIRDLTVVTTPDHKNKTLWTLKVNVYLESASNKEFDAIFNINLDENHLISNQKKIIKPLTDKSVEVMFEIPIKSIPIIAWFPNGVANNTQKLYGLNVRVTFPDHPVDKYSHSVQARTKKIGFRTIEVVEELVKPRGMTFYFKINGLPFFAKGANWIPANSLQEDITEEYLREMLLSAKQANMNMLRVWGGGKYTDCLKRKYTVL